MTLSSLDFTDLYVSRKGCWMKSTHVDGAVPVPGNLSDTMLEVFGQCQQMETEVGSTDFALVIDGLRYRAARMEAMFEVFYVLLRFPVEVPNIETLGYGRPVLRRLLRDDLTGLVVIAGATGSGKTTTASALLLERLNRFGGVGVAIEDPPEMPLEGSGDDWACFQVPVHDGDFAVPCRSMLRWSPSIIFLGEIRDGKTAIEAIRAGINGHLVICTLHADSVIASIERFYALASTETCPEDAASQLSSSAAAFVHQRIEREPRVALMTKTLFCRGDEGMAPRNNIRQRRFSMLEADIQRQERTMLNERH